MLETEFQGMSERGYWYEAIVLLRTGFGRFRGGSGGPLRAIAILP